MTINSLSSYVFLCFLLCFGTIAFAQLEQYQWKTVETIGSPDGRHENAFVKFDNKFYLIGGRGINHINVYNPKTNEWKTKGKTPIEMHHFQAVVHKNVIYVVGGMTGRYPKEQPLTNIWKYYPKKDMWKKGVEIPRDRRRGGAGTVIYNNKIYLVGGIKFGHTSGTTNFFDCFDITTQKWETLTDAPHIRDHFSAITVKDKLYCIGGRNTSVHYRDSFSAFFKAIVAEVDYYDFKTNNWYTMRNPLPIPTAAGAVIYLKNKLIYFGGESNQKLAHNQTQCLDLESYTWKTHSPMIMGRHGTGAILHQDAIYIAAGSEKRGGGKLTSMEVFKKE